MFCFARTSNINIDFDIIFTFDKKKRKNNSELGTFFSF